MTRAVSATAVRTVVSSCCCSASLFFVGAFVVFFWSFGWLFVASSFKQCLFHFGSTLFPGRVRVLGLPRQGLRDCGIAGYGGSRQPCLSHLTFRAHSTLVLRRPRECGCRSPRLRQSSRPGPRGKQWARAYIAMRCICSVSSVSLSLSLPISFSLSL